MNIPSRYRSNQMVDGKKRMSHSPKGSKVTIGKRGAAVVDVDSMLVWYDLFGWVARTFRCHWQRAPSYHKACPGCAQTKSSQLILRSAGEGLLVTDMKAMIFYFHWACFSSSTISRFYYSHYISISWPIEAFMRIGGLYRLLA